MIGAVRIVVVAAVAALTWGCADDRPTGHVTVEGTTGGGVFFEGAALVVALVGDDGLVAQWRTQPLEPWPFPAFAGEVPVGDYGIWAWHLDCLQEIDCTQVPDDGPEEVGLVCAGWPPWTVACAGRVEVRAGAVARVEVAPLMGPGQCRVEALARP